MFFIKFKDIFIITVLFGVGLLLDAVIRPNTFFGILPSVFDNAEPDILLSMLFIGIILYPSLKNVLVLSFITSFLSILSNDYKFGVGYFANFITIPISALLVYRMLTLFKRKNSFLIALVLILIGSFIRWSFLIFIIGSIPPDLLLLISSFFFVVLPVTAFNTMFVIVFYPVIRVLKKNLLFEIV